MEESLRSGGVVKKKTSSGCLIVKKKGDVLGGGGGFSHMEKKRPRMFLGEFGQGENSLETARRKYNTMPDESLVYSRRAVEDQEYGGNVETSENSWKRSRVVEYDEYNEFDGKNMRNDFSEIVRRSGSSRELIGGPSRKVLLEKRKLAKFHTSSSGLGWTDEAVDFGVKRSHGMDEDEDCPRISFPRLNYQKETAQSIRLQGKNGVLKVMINKKKKMDPLSTSKLDHQVLQNRSAFKSEDVNKEDTPISSPFYLDSKRSDKRDTIVESNKRQLKVEKSILSKHKKLGNCERERKELKLKKSLLGKGNRAANDVNRSDTSLKLAPPNWANSGSMKSVKMEGEKSLPAENFSPVKAREGTSTLVMADIIQKKCTNGKAKHSGSTEKQLLRVRIREMLLKCGWTIDYRPRRNREYLDSVYINPSGTAYWSIIKAYEALQKQLQEAGPENQKHILSSPFAPLSDSVLNKLTRQTKKKIEKMKNAKKAASKLSYGPSDDDLGNDLIGEKNGQGNTESPSAITSNVVQARTSRRIGRCTLLVRTFGHHSESDGYVPYTGKRTLLAWLIDSGMVQLSERVQFMNRQRTRVKLEGWVTREGIHCGCCSKILTITKFELHAGSKLRQPCQNIILESGPSLLQCLIDAWKKQGESARQNFNVVDADGDDPDDDTCAICGDGGDLICCDGCPSTYHLSCLGIQILPPGDWHCPNCICKFCGTADGNDAEEDVETSSELIMCNLCEQKYHEACSKRISAALVDSNGPPTFCGKKCREIHDNLQKILWVKHELESGFSWSLIRRTDLDCDTTDGEYPQRVEGNAKLAVALSAIDECFVPIMDRRSGINLIHNVLYNCGSNFSRLDFRGFYTMVLERGDEIISTASIRFRGTQLAEMPYIGTRHMYRRQGMCRRLLSAIESVLCSFGIEKLVIPAIGEHMRTWTAVFGFKQIEESHRNEMKMLNLLVFPGLDWLQKPLLKQEIPEADMKYAESNNNSSPGPVLLESSDMDPLRKEGTDIGSDDIGSDDTSKSAHEADAVVPVVSASPTSSKNTRVLHAFDHADCEENKCVDAQIMKGLPQSSGVLNSNSPSDMGLAALQATNCVSCHQVTDITEPSAEYLTGANNESNFHQARDAESITLLEPQSQLQLPLETSYEAEDMQNLGNQCSSLKVYDDASPEDKSTLIKQSPGPIRETSMHASGDTANGTCMEFVSVSSTCLSDEPLVQVSSALDQGTVVDGESASPICSIAGASVPAKVDTSRGSQEFSVVEDVGSNGITEGIIHHHLTAPDFLEEATNQNIVEELKKNADPNPCPSDDTSKSAHEADAILPVVSASTTSSKNRRVLHGVDHADETDARDWCEENKCVDAQIMKGLAQSSGVLNSAQSSGVLNSNSPSDMGLAALRATNCVSCHQVTDITDSSAECLTGASNEDNFYQTQDAESITLLEPQSKLQMPLEASYEAEDMQNLGNRCSSLKVYGDAFPEALDESTLIKQSPGPIRETSLQASRDTTDGTYMEFGCVSSTFLSDEPLVQVSSALAQGTAVDGGSATPTCSEICSIAGDSVPAKVDMSHGSQFSIVEDVGSNGITEGRIRHLRTAPDFLEEATNQNIAEELKKKADPSPTPSPHNNIAVANPYPRSNAQNIAEVENKLSTASDFGSGLVHPVDFSGEQLLTNTMEPTEKSVASPSWDGSSGVVPTLPPKNEVDSSLPLLSKSPLEDSEIFYCP